MKVKMIDILNRIAEEKNIPIKIKINDKVYIYDKKRNWYYFFEDVLVFINLNDEVEILDNETDEIKELPRSDSYVTQIEDNKNKINELVRAVNKIQKEQVLTKSLNIISDCAKETNCMSD